MCRCTVCDVALSLRWEDLPALPDVREVAEAVLLLWGNHPSLSEPGLVCPSAHLPTQSHQRHLPCPCAVLHGCHLLRAVHDRLQRLRLHVQRESSGSSAGKRAGEGHACCKRNKHTGCCWDWVRSVCHELPGAVACPGKLLTNSCGSAHIVSLPVCSNDLHLPALVAGLCGVHGLRLHGLRLPGLCLPRAPVAHICAACPDETQTLLREQVALLVMAKAGKPPRLETMSRAPLHRSRMPSSTAPNLMSPHRG